MVIVFLALCGLMVGSFLNVCVYRLPREESVVFPPSHCMACGNRLAWRDLIPVVSYLLLRGKCRYCGSVFSRRYLLVELLTAGLFVVCVLLFGWSLALAKALVLTSFLIVISFIDLDHQLILDNTVIWLAGAGVACNLLLIDTGILDMLLGALLGGGLLLLIAVVSKGGMGGGDIKFAAALGLWFGWKMILLILLLSFVFGGVGGALAMALRLKSRKDFIPFGPFIALAAFLALLYGPEMLAWYFRQVL